MHPNEASHSLEAIAARLGVTVSGRHTALGDALATAEVFLKLASAPRASAASSPSPQAREAARGLLLRKASILIVSPNPSRLFIDLRVARTRDAYALCMLCA